jgi:predicted MFS family arabinose efflux permease
VLARRIDDQARRDQGRGGTLATLALVLVIASPYLTMLPPLLPELREELGLSVTEIGLLSACYPAGQLIAAIPQGALIARLGARRVTLGGLSVLAAGGLWMGVAPDLFQLGAARMTQGIGSAMTWIAVLAWATSLAGPRRAARDVGVLIAASMVGSLLGSLIVAVAPGVPPRQLFAALGAVTLAIFPLVARLPATHDAHLAQARARGRSLRNSQAVRSLWLVALPAGGFGVVLVLAPLSLDGAGATEAGTAIIWFIGTLAGALASVVVGRTTERGGADGHLLTSLALLGAGFAVCVLQPDLVAVVGAQVIVVTAATSLFWAPGHVRLVWVVEAAGLQGGHGSALFALSYAGGGMVGGAAGGWLADAFGVELPYLLLASATAATLVATARRSAGRRLHRA